MAPKVTEAEVVPTAAPLEKTEKPPEIVVVADASPETSPATGPGDAARTVLTSSADRAADAAVANAGQSDEVRVLRDVATAEAGPSLGQDPAVASQPSQGSRDDAASVQRLPSTAIPEPALAAESSTPAPAPNPVRAVVPEPQYPVTEILPSAEPQAEAPQPKPVASRDAAQATSDVVHSEPRVSTGLAAQVPMKAIGPAWEEPARLLVDLEELKRHEVTRLWATETAMAVHSLGPAISVGTPQTAAILRHMEQLTSEAPRW